MSAMQNYWAKAQTGSPGSQLSALQEKLYEGETTLHLMQKFDHKMLNLTMGISDPTELQAAQQQAQALIAEKQAIANAFSTQSDAVNRTAVVKLVIKAGVKPDHDTVRRAGNHMVPRLLLTAVMHCG